MLPFFTVLAALLLCSAQSVTIFVAPGGNDLTGDGSLQNPYATWTRASTAVQSLNGNMQEDIYVYFRAGTYFVPSTITLTAKDSGSNGFTVHYASYPGDSTSAVLHGGVAVTGWTLSDPSKNIWSAPLPAGVTDARQMYIGTDPTGPMYRMQVPNTGGGIPGGSGVTLTSWGYTTPDGQLAAWAQDPHQNAADIEFLYTGVGSSWTECRVRVSTITSAGGSNITMALPGFALATGRYYGQGVTKPASIANVYALLTASTPGQYYLNSATRTVYYVPRPQDDMPTAIVIVPSTTVFLQVQGDRDAQPVIQPVHNIALANLTFAYASWLDVNTGIGWVDMQSGFRVLPNTTDQDDTWLPPPANIQLNTVKDVSITGCTFTHLGSTAVQVQDGSQDVYIAGNTFRDISCGGLYLGQISDANLTDVTRMNARMMVYNNLFDGIPSEYHDCSVLLGGFLVNSTFDHNSILNNSNTGISLGWGWSRDEATNAGGNVISNNYVFGGNWLLEDGGSLYVLGPQPNSTMVGNYISNQQKLFGALYTDEGSAYWTLTQNVVHACPEWLHIWTASIHDETVEDCWTDQAYQIVHGTRITMVNNTVLQPGQPWPPAAQAIINNAGTLAMAGPKP